MLRSAGQSLALCLGGNGKLSLAFAESRKKRIGRGALKERYRPLILSNKTFSRHRARKIKVGANSKASAYALSHYEKPTKDCGLFRHSQRRADEPKRTPYFLRFQCLNGTFLWSKHKIQ